MGILYVQRLIMLLKKYLLIIALINSFFIHIAQAQEPDWQDYRQLLATIKQGEKNGISLALVDYATLQKNRAVEKIYQQISAFPVDSLSGKAELIAFYINTYNILAIKMVVDHWPVASIKEVGSFFRPVWGKDAGRIGGYPVSLDDIENKFLRPLGQPQIHFSIVCASVSCPDLRNEPYTAINLSQQLADQTKQFLNNTQKGLRIEGDAILVSKIFSWFKQDFKASGGVNAFIRNNRPDLPTKYRIDAEIDYDWSLNSLP